jgi:L-alanine-DL-glutamate epimerase-like enolase superfamily enzyme
MAATASPTAQTPDGARRERTREPDVPVERLQVAAYTIPTDAPEGDGTLSWTHTTIVVVHAHAGGTVGLGYTYADLSTAKLIHRQLAGVVCGMSATAPRAAWHAMVRATRNLGRPGIVSMAISAVDVALWDLHARLLHAPLCAVLGAARERVPVYGSGGFTTYTDRHLREQVSGWLTQGLRSVKIKIGWDPAADPARVRVVREAAGEDVQLMVDANGAPSRKHALALAQRLREDSGVVWFEEPVSSDDLDGLRLLRDRAPAGMEIAAGEYGYDALYFQRMLAAQAVDVLQADVTRCGGFTELLRVDALCHAAQVPLSLHCAPAAHVHCGCALERLRHLEHFHDHVRIEQMIFDGLPALRDGALWPALDRPGIGLELKRADAERYAAH